MVCYTLTVAQVRQETNDAVTVCFKQPTLKKIKYKAGQYLTLIFRINGRRYLRPYSFSSAPGVDPLLEVTIKRVPGGVVSNHIYDTVKVGDLVEVLEAMGDFTVEETSLAKKKHVVLWGAGSGITPLFSIAKYTLANSECKVTLVYGNRNRENVIFLNKIKELAEFYQNRVSIWHFHTQLFIEDSMPYVIQGRIAPEKVLSVMEHEGDLLESVHYVCGPVGLKESVRGILAKLKISSSNIFTEDFELVKDEKVLKDVVTRNVTILKGTNRTIVEVVKGRSILEACLDAAIDLSYSCQTGKCSVCRGKVTMGGVKQIVERHKDLGEDEYQLCCTFPLTDNVEVVV